MGPRKRRFSTAEERESGGRGAGFGRRFRNEAGNGRIERRLREARSKFPCDRGAFALGRIWSGDVASVTAEIFIGGVVMTGTVIGSDSRRRSERFAAFTVSTSEAGSISRR